MSEYLYQSASIDQGRFRARPRTHNLVATVSAPLPLHPKIKTQPKHHYYHHYFSVSSRYPLQSAGATKPCAPIAASSAFAGPSSTGRPRASLRALRSASNAARAWGQRPAR